MNNESQVTFDDFAKLDIRIGEIIEAERIPDTDKLLKLKVNTGTGETRQIIAGIAEFFPDPKVLVNKKCPFLVNLEPRTIKGYESNGMILAIDTGDGFSLLVPDSDAPVGSIIR